MRRLFILVLALTCISSFAFAAQMTWGARLGMNMANVSGDGIQDNNSKIGLHLGGMMQYGINDKFMLQPELLFSMKGVKIEPTGFKNTESLNYIEIPILVKYNLPMNNFTLQPYLGPSIGILMSAKSKVEVGGQTTTTDIKDTTTGSDFGLNLGVDAVVKTQFVVGLRYGMGLSDIIKDNQGDAVTNTNFMLTLGYLFAK